MRILFTTEHRSSVSTEINLENLKQVDQVPGVSLCAYQQDYQNFDVILFMGYDPQIEKARAANPSAKIGVIDVRPSHLERARTADFLLSNGPEMSSMAARYFSNIFEYPIYPLVTGKKKEGTNSRRITITYHGNKQHAVSMFPHVTRALEELAKEIDLELLLIFNRKALLDIPAQYLPRGVRHSTIDWHENVYNEEMAETDIGIVPNLTPLKNRTRALTLSTLRDSAFGSNETEFLHRYKPTSNPGRILAFAQLGIPVVADLYPSAAQVIRNGVSGYLAHDAFSWYQSLRTLCIDHDRRERMGKALLQTFDNWYAIAGVNERFVDFCRELPPPVTAPDSLINAERLLDRADGTSQKFVDLAAGSVKRISKLFRNNAADT